MTRFTRYAIAPLCAIFIFAALVTQVCSQEESEKKAGGKAEGTEAGSKIIATVNGQPVTEKEVDLLFKLKDSRQAREYVTMLVIQRKAVEQFLDKQGVTADPEKVAEEVKTASKELEDRGFNLQGKIEELGITEDDLYDEMEFRIRLDKYIQKDITDEDIIENMGRVSASHILISTKDRTDEKALAQIREIERDLRASADLEKDFAEAAKEYSDCPSGKNSGGRLRPFFRMGMVKPFSDMAFQLMPGQMSPPVKTQFGYHLILLHERMPVTEEEFKKRGEILRRIYAELKKQTLVRELTDKAEIKRFDDPKSTDGKAGSDQPENGEGNKADGPEDNIE